MEKFFNIRYEFDKRLVWEHIDRQIAAHEPGFICVADGVVVDNVQRNPLYRQTVDNGMFAICDSGWIPLYLKWIYGIKRSQYCGPMIFKDLVIQAKYRMIFMGTNRTTLDHLQKELAKMNPDVMNMTFHELPFKTVDEFDYPSIARMIEEDQADIIWIALGAPKQDYFMSKLKHHLRRGVMIGVGAAFNFYSGCGERRAPSWITRMHLEFLYRILQSPKKQLARCWGIVNTLPRMLVMERKRALLFSFWQQKEKR
ncbi:MAG: WecB/TagA/CpsF family glycosyltransferase [Bacteroides sp]|nr:WecB/TagA/CpsF family glycosyltransferase [Bacteroides sp.]